MKNGIKVIILLILAICLIIFSSEIISSIDFSLNIFKNNVFPTLFPFFVISGLLINYGLVEFLSKLLSPVMTKVFKTNPNSSFIFVMSIISGFPSSARYTAELLNKGLITEKDANKIILFSHFSNPIFILTTLSVTFLNNTSVGYLILFAHYIGNIIIGLIFRNYNVSNITKSSIDKREILSFGSALTKSVKNAIDTLLLILGTTTTFIIFTTIINKLIPINNYNKSILNGLFELTQGLKYVSLLEIPLRFKATISSLLLSFGSFSIHAQVISIVKINYAYYLTSRIFHALISSLITYVVFDLFVSLF